MLNVVAVSPLLGIINFILFADLDDDLPVWITQQGD